MSKPKITFYIDVVSPFAYEAYYLLRHDPTFRNVEKTYIPVFLGGIMKTTGNVPPINIKNKDTWINKERKRWSKLFDIPMQRRMYPKFPIMTLYVQRVLAALTILDDDNERFAQVIDKLWEAFWVRHEDISNKDVYEKIIGEVVGADVVQKAVGMAGEEGKKLVLENTEKALKEGAFGLPWMVCTDSKGVTEGFWGVDHIGQVVQFLGLEIVGQKAGGNAGWKSVL